MYDIYIYTLLYTIICIIYIIYMYTLYILHISVYIYIGMVWNEIWNVMECMYV